MQMEAFSNHTQQVNKTCRILVYNSMSHLLFRLLYLLATLSYFLKDYFQYQKLVLLSGGVIAFFNNDFRENHTSCQSNYGIFTQCV